MFFGIILGILLTIGAAFVADTFSKPAAGTIAEPIVNWDVLWRKLKALSQILQEQLARFTGPRKGA